MLGYCKITVEGARVIAEAMKRNESLLVLDLGTDVGSTEVGQNQLGDVGLKSVAEALKHNHTLASLNFGTDLRAGNDRSEPGWSRGRSCAGRCADLEPGTSESQSSY